MDRSDLEHSGAGMLLFPDCGVPPELYWNALEEGTYENAAVHDYGFFTDGDEPLNRPMIEEEDCPPVIIGHSFGVLSAVKLAIQYPDAVNRLVLVTPFARLLRTEDFPAGVAPERFKSIRDSFLKAPHAALKSLLDIYASPGTFRGTLPENINVRAVTDAFDIMAETDIRGYLSLLQDVSVCIIDAGLDALVSRGMADEAAEVIEGAERRTFHDAGHLVLFDRGPECADLILKGLDS